MLGSPPRRKASWREASIYSLNEAEPDAMNPVIDCLAKACENELYQRIFGPYIAHLLSNAVRDYLNDGNSTQPLIKSGQVQTYNLRLGSYSWHLRNDPNLKRWIEMTSKRSIPPLTA